MRVCSIYNKVSIYNLVYCIGVDMNLPRSDLLFVTRDISVFILVLISASIIPATGI